MHTGHALNKILKDIINRHRLLQGYRVNYIPGWDCHGLPIEVKALEKLKVKNHKSMDPIAIRKIARETALAAVDVQKKSFRRLSILGDWSSPYITLSPAYEARQLRVFQHFLRQRWIFRRHRPIYWSPSSKTALAEAELEYASDHVSTSAYISFPLIMRSESKDSLSEKVQAIISSRPNIPKDTTPQLVIWTTTPWTLPANCVSHFRGELLLEHCTAGFCEMSRIQVWVNTPFLPLTPLLGMNRPLLFTLK